MYNNLSASIFRICIYVPYSSLEAVVENNKEGYYLALRQTQGTLQNDKPNWHPWVLFFLKVGLQSVKLLLLLKQTEIQ